MTLLSALIALVVIFAVYMKSALRHLNIYLNTLEYRIIQICDSSLGIFIVSVDHKSKILDNICPLYVAILSAQAL